MAVGNLRGNHFAGNHAGRIKVVGCPILFTPQEDVAGRKADDRRTKTPIGVEHRNSNALFSAGSHELGTATDTAKTDETIEIVKGDPQPSRTFDSDDNGFPLSGDVSTFGGDEERGQGLLHEARPDSPSCISELGPTEAICCRKPR